MEEKSQIGRFFQQITKFWIGLFISQIVDGQINRRGGDGVVGWIIYIAIYIYLVCRN